MHRGSPAFSTIHPIGREVAEEKLHSFAIGTEAVTTTLINN